MSRSHGRAKAMAHITRRAFSTLGATVLLVGPVGCATHGGALARSTPPVVVDAVDHDRCEAFARAERDVTRRYVVATRAEEYATLERNAEARFKEADSVGYRASSLGPGTSVAVDLRPGTAVGALLILIPEAVFKRIASVLDMVQKPATAYTEAREECLHALALVADPGSDLEGVAQRLHELGRRFGSQGKFAEAEELQRRVLALQGPTLFPVHAAAAESLQSLVKAYHARGQHAD